MKNSKLHTTEDKSNEKVTSSNSKSEDTLDDTLERLLIEYGVSGFNGHEKAILAWHKAEIAKLFEQIRSEAQPIAMTVKDEHNPEYDKTKPYLAVTVEALTRLESRDE